MQILPPGQVPREARRRPYRSFRAGPRGCRRSTRLAASAMRVVEKYLLGKTGDPTGGEDHIEVAADLIGVF